MRTSLASVHGWTVDKPRNPTADFPGRKPGKRVSGVSFSLGYFSFGQAKEKYLALRRRMKALRSDASTQKIRCDSGLRRNDEHRAIDVRMPGDQFG
jgi:hypothetical protein